MTDAQNGRVITDGGTPLVVQPRHNGNGVIVSQGRSYLVIGVDEIPALVQAISEVSGVPA